MSVQSAMHGPRGLGRIACGALAAAFLCTLLAACGGDSSSEASRSPGAAATAPEGAGGASDPVAIVTPPAAGVSEASGVPCTPPPANTQLNCAP